MTIREIIHRCVLVFSALALVGSIDPAGAVRSDDLPSGQQWIGTWAASPQAPRPGRVQTFRNQTLRLVVHTSAGGSKARVRISNVFGDQPLVVAGAHIARRTAEAGIDPATDRALLFRGRASTTVAPRSIVVSDPVDLAVPALSDLAISLYLPDATAATTVHILAVQTSYVSTETGDATAAASFPVGQKIDSWPFLAGVDVAASSRAATIVAFGSSTTDGDGTTTDGNHRWPDVLAARLQKRGGRAAELGVVNQGIIGNRLLHDSPLNSRFGASLGEAGVTRFERDVLAQPGVKYVFMGLGINDIAFPAFPFTPPTETVTPDEIIAGYRQLVARAHAKGIRMIGTTLPAFENSTFTNPKVFFYTPEREAQRQRVNDWIKSRGAFDGVVDFDEAVRDPGRPTQLLPRFDSGDHLHPNDAGNIASGNAIPLTLFDRR
jgi:lysophospholipase L1-like esterase